MAAPLLPLLPSPLLLSLSLRSPFFNLFKLFLQIIFPWEFKQSRYVGIVSIVKLKFLIVLVRLQVFYNSHCLQLCTLLSCPDSKITYRAHMQSSQNPSKIHSALSKLDLILVHVCKDEVAIQTRFPTKVTLRMNSRRRRKMKNTKGKMFY